MRRLVDLMRTGQAERLYLSEKEFPMDIVLTENEIVHGEQPCLTDADVLVKIEQIRVLEGNARWMAFDALVFEVINHHPHGMAADILNVVFAEWDEEVIDVLG